MGGAVADLHCPITLADDLCKPFAEVIDEADCRYASFRPRNWHRVDRVLVRVLGVALIEQFAGKRDASTAQNVFGPNSLFLLDDERSVYRR